jgi:hypothetical protein
MVRNCRVSRILASVLSRKERVKPNRGPPLTLESVAAAKFRLAVLW